MTPETRLKNEVRSYLKDIGAFSLKRSDRFSAGHPDLTIYYRGRTIEVELKAESGIVKGIQEWTIEQIKAQGCEAYIIRSVEELKEII